MTGPHGALSKGRFIQFDDDDGLRPFVDLVIVGVLIRHLIFLGSHDLCVHPVQLSSIMRGRTICKPFVGFKRAGGLAPWFVEGARHLVLFNSSRLLLE
jgi:hypothetical protein